MVAVFFSIGAQLPVITGPGTNTIVSRVIELAVSVSDASPMELYYRIDGSEPITFNGTVSPDTAALSDGRHVITVETRDEAGNAAQETIVIYIDNTPPGITITSLAYGSRCTGREAAITWSITEGNLEKTTLVIDGKEIGVTGKTSYTINIEEPTAGKHTVTIKAVDKTGHAAEETNDIPRREALTGTHRTLSYSSTDSSTCGGCRLVSK